MKLLLTADPREVMEQQAAELIVECDNSGAVWRGNHGGSGPVPGSPGQLNHMGDDPGEVYNRFRDNPAVVRELHDKLDHIRAAEEQ